MSRLLSLVLYDFKFQWKYGFHFAYIVIAFFYIILLRFLPENFRNYAAQFIIYTDTSILGLFFIGGIILLEKSQKTIEYLFVSPVKIYEYLISKVISLTFLATFISYIIIIAGYGVRFNHILFLLSVMFSSALFVIIGIIIVANVKTINIYIMRFTLVSPLFILPLVSMFKIYDHWGFYLLPTQCTYRLIEYSLNGNAKIGVTLFSMLYLIAFLILLFRRAYKDFYKYVLLKVGDDA